MSEFDAFRIEFVDQPRRTHLMEYYGDRRKDRFLRGGDMAVSPFPRVKILDCFARSGCLKVATVRHEGERYFHPNLLCNKRGQRDGYVDEYGVATYAFENTAGEIIVELKDLCIRHSNKKNDFEKIKKKWIPNFDPQNLGFGSKQGIKMDYVSLCCQAIFSDGVASNWNISESIFNGPDDLKIEYWEENKRVKEDGGDTPLYLLTRELSTDQRNEIHVRFTIDHVETGVSSHMVRPIKIHHNNTLVVKIPSYQTITRTADGLAEETECSVDLVVNGKNYYKSNVKTFTFVPIERIPTRRNFFNVNNDEPRRGKKRARYSNTRSYNNNSAIQPSTSQAAAALSKDSQTDTSEDEYQRQSTLQAMTILVDPQINAIQDGYQQQAVATSIYPQTDTSEDGYQQQFTLQAVSILVDPQTNSIEDGYQQQAVATSIYPQTNNSAYESQLNNPSNDFDIFSGMNELINIDDLLDFDESFLNGP